MAYLSRKVIKSSMNPIVSTIEEIAKIGWYETDLLSGSWTGSDNFIKLFGLERKQRYAIEEFQALIHPDDFQQVMDTFALCLKNGNDFNCEYRCRIPDGKIIHVLSRSKIFYDAAGKPIRVVGVKQDVSAQKVFENELLRLTELNRRKTELLGFVAHDLRSPIAQMKSLALLLKCHAAQDQMQLLEMQLKVSDTAMNLIQELLDICESEHGVIEPSFEEVNINELINESVERFSERAKEREIHLNTEFCNNPFIKLDHRRFSRVMDNLLSNALKFTPSLKNVYIITESTMNSVVVKVKDEGIGIPEHIIPALFTKFSKVAKRSGIHGERSTGLGLSIVKQIVDLHGGTMNVETVVNGGTTFSIELYR